MTPNMGASSLSNDRIDVGVVWADDEGFDPEPEPDPNSDDGIPWCEKSDDARECAGENEMDDDNDDTAGGARS